MGRISRCNRTLTAARGFTLMEASLAVVIVAFGFLASMELFAACTAENRRSAQVTTAQMLTTSLHEMTTGLTFKDPFYATTTFGPELGESLATFNDLDDLDGFTSSPPIDATRTPIPELSQYQQVVTVMPIDPNRPGANADEKTPEIQKTTYTGGVRVRVTILYRRVPKDPPSEILKSSWVRLDD